MPAAILTEAVERSTYVIEVTFSDEEGVTVTPSKLTWTLTTDSGAVVNNRQAVPVLPATVTRIVLTDGDLALLGGMDGGRRFLLLEGTYDSTLGRDLSIRDEVAFSIRNLVKVT